jgi:hypothetical protein
MSGDGWKYMPGRPRTSAGCGERIKLNSEAIWFKTSAPKTTWHAACKRGAK